MKTDLEIAFISFNKSGSMYIAYKVPQVQNHIRPGSKPRDELLIVGIPAKKVFNWLAQHEFTFNDLIKLCNNFQPEAVS